MTSPLADLLDLLAAGYAAAPPSPESRRTAPHRAAAPQGKAGFLASKTVSLAVIPARCESAAPPFSIQRACSGGRQIHTAPGVGTRYVLPPSMEAEGAGTFLDHPIGTGPAALHCTMYYCVIAQPSALLSFSALLSSALLCSSALLLYSFLFCSALLSSAIFSSALLSYFPPLLSSPSLL